MKRIVDVLGPSGIGKSYLSEKLTANKFLYVHIDTDSKGRTSAAKGFPSEWDDDFHKIDFACLLGILRDRLDDEHVGAVISFPTVFVFAHERLFEAAQLGIIPLVLWGRRENCIKAAEERIRKKGLTFNLQRYERLNEPAFRAYGRPEYDAFRLEAFRKDGSRYPDKEWLARTMERILANNGIKADAVSPDCLFRTRQL